MSLPRLALVVAVGLSLAACSSSSKTAAPGTSPSSTVLPGVPTNTIDPEAALSDAELASRRALSAKLKQIQLTSSELPSMGLPGSFQDSGLTFGPPADPSLNCGGTDPRASAVKAVTNVFNSLPEESTDRRQISSYVTAYATADDASAAFAAGLAALKGCPKGATTYPTYDKTGSYSTDVTDLDASRTDLPATTAFSFDSVFMTVTPEAGPTYRFTEIDQLSGADVLQTQFFSLVALTDTDRAIALSLATASGKRLVAAG